MDQLADMVLSASEGVINRQKQHILGTSMAIATLFDKGKTIDSLFQEMDGMISKAKAGVGNNEDQLLRKEEKRQRDMKKSMENLGKLRMFMGK